VISFFIRAAQELGKINPFLRVVYYIGVATIFAIVVFATIDVVLRYGFNRPILGGVEIVELLMVMAASCMMAYTQVEKRHVAAGVLSSRLSEKGRAVLNLLIYSISIVLFTVLTWQTANSIIYSMENRAGTSVLSLPLFPFYGVLALGMAALTIVLIRDLVSSIVEALKVSLGPRWLLYLLGVGAAVAIIWLAMNPSYLRLSPPAVGAIGLLGFLALMFLGLPVSFSCFTVAILGIFYLRAVGPALVMAGTVPFRTVATYTWAVFPTFMSMGFLAYRAGFGKDLFAAAYKWVGQLPGGLAMASTLSCTGFGAICGDETATAVTIGSVAYPEMRRYKYDDGLAASCVTAGGGIGILIPPSLGFIIYGILTEENIGDLFMSGIVPGLILSALICVYIYIRCRLNPGAGPPGPSTTMKEKLKAAGTVWPVALLFLMVIGGIYGGVFTASEGGAVGASAVLLVGLALRRYSLRSIIDAFSDTGKVMGMAFTLLMSVFLFGYFIAMSNLPYQMASFIVSIGLSPLLTLITIMILLVFLGCIMPALPMILLTIPIFFPIALAYGWNPIWFGVLYVIMLALAPLTPPYGYVGWVMSAVLGVPVGKLFRNLTYLIILYLILTGLIVAFPPLATWLPSLLRG